MHVFFSAVLSLFGGRLYARQMFVRRLLWLVLTGLLVGHMLPASRSTTVFRAQTERKLPAQQRLALKENAASPLRPKYKCSERPPQNSKEGEKYVEQAIDDALKILKECEPCRRMFNSEDPDYAVNLLERLRRDKVIIISATTPRWWKLGSDGNLKVSEYVELKESAAGTVDLAGQTSGEMKKPCVYINPTGFMVTGLPAENFGLYKVKPHIQRAVGILHELGHVAGVLQLDDQAPKDDKETKDDAQGKEKRQGNVKSVANTDCVRSNCISCQAFRPCTSAPEAPKPTLPKRQTSSLYPSMLTGSYLDLRL